MTFTQRRKVSLFPSHYLNLQVKKVRGKENLNLPIRIRIFAFPNNLLKSEETVNPILYFFLPR